MKRIKKTLTAVLMLLAMAAGSASAAVPTATFTNVPSASADLQIRKEVVSSVPGYKANPDTLFTFHVIKNGQSYRNQEYTVIDANGDTVQRYDETYPSVKIPWKTNDNGDLKLKDGWTAVFAYFGSGASYEVEERNIPDGYSQIMPAAGMSYAGTLAQKGELLTCINRYSPPVDSETGSLVLTKQLVYPQGYTLPQTPLFTFEIQIDGMPYSNQPYAVTDSNGTELRKETTDDRGRLEIGAQERAVLNDLPTGVDYRIMEEAKDGWQVIGNAEQEGVLTGRTTEVQYTNAFADFAVKKELADDTETERETDQEFLFSLLGSAGEPLANTAYYLYSSEGVLQEEPLKTGETGSFSLRAGETAVFTGMEAQTFYRIREEHTEGWRTIQPEDPEGFKGETKPGSVPVIHFINAPGEEEPVKGSITVRKLGEEGQVLAGAEFVLTRKDDGEIVETVVTDEKGTAVFEELEPDTYILTETKTGEGLSLLSDAVTVELPLVMTDNEAKAANADTSAGQYHTDSRSWYFYDLKYEITNHAVLEMPLAGGTAVNPWIPAGLMCLLAAGVLMLNRKKVRA